MTLIKKVVSLKEDDEDKVITEEKERKNFWECGAYQAVLTRLENSFEFSEMLIEMYDEIASQEAKYAKFLTDWSEKWQKNLVGYDDLGNKDLYFYGTTKNTLLSVVRMMSIEGKSRMESWSKIQSQCIMPLRTYCNELHSKPYNTWQRGKDLKEDFRTTQEPYLEASTCHRKAKQKYISACMMIDSSFRIDNDHEFISSLDKKRRDKIDVLRRRYSERLDQLNLMLEPYKDKMLTIYEKCEKYEEIRLSATKSSLEALCSILDSNNNKQHKEILFKMEESVAKLNVEEDLIWWCETRGPKMEFDHYKVEEKTRPISTFHTLIQLPAFKKLQQASKKATNHSVD